MDEVIFEEREDEVDGGFVATAFGHAIATQDDSISTATDQLRFRPVAFVK